MKDVPSLFGRVTSVLIDHAQLRKTVAQLHSACELGSRHGSPVNLRVLTASFSVQLREHFAAEEADGNFGAIVDARPDLMDAIAQRKNEHSEMRSILDAVDGSVRRIELADLATVVSALLHLFERHEAEESALIRQFVNWKDSR